MSAPKPSAAHSEPDQPHKWDLGDRTVTLINGGALKLDGGAMFGIIPKALWSRATPADEHNRIGLACNCLLVEFGGETDRRLIIETGHGTHYAEKEQRIFDIDPARWLLPALRAYGVDAESITDVAVSHLHFDHAGGLTHDVDGRLSPTFPNARVHVQRREFEDARGGFGVMTATYREENFTPIDEIDGWRLLDGDEEIAPGVRALCLPGHTRGHQGIVVAGSDRTLVFAGDLMPTAAHVGAAFNMSYDLLPIDNRATKLRLLAQVARERWLIAIDHEISTPVVTAEPDGKHYALEPAE